MAFTASLVRFLAPFTFAFLAGPILAASLTWSGDGGANIWDTNSSANWNGGTAKFQTGDSVTFDDTTGNTAVTIDQFVVPGAVTISSTSNYVFVGTGGIQGTTTLTKSGTGTLRLITENSYAGATAVNGGTLLVIGTLNGSAVTVNSGGTLGGTGAITTGNQALTLNAGAHLAPGVNTGALTINTGTAALNLSAAISGSQSGALAFQLADPESSDQLVLSAGSLQIGSGELSFADFSFELLEGFGQGTYSLFSTTQPLGGFLAADPGSLAGSLGGFTATLVVSGSGTGLSLVVIPEPSSAAFFLGAALLGGSGLFRRSRSFTAHRTAPAAKYQPLALTGQMHPTFGGKATHARSGRPLFV